MVNSLGPITPSRRQRNRGTLPITAGTYKEYHAQYVDYLKELCQLRGIPYVNKKWASLLLSLTSQGKMNQDGVYDIHFVGSFDSRLNAHDSLIYIIRNGHDVGMDIPWDKISNSLRGVVRVRKSKTIPGDNPYKDIEIGDL